MIGVTGFGTGLTRYLLHLETLSPAGSVGFKYAKPRYDEDSSTAVFSKIYTKSNAQ